MKPKSRAEAEKLLGKRTPLPGAGKKAGANWDVKKASKMDEDKEDKKIRASDAFRSSNKKVPIATVKRMRKAGLD